VRGNHDKACAGIDDLEWFNPVARVSAVWTMTTIRPENLEYLRGLQRGPLPIDGFELVHGSPLDEDEYVLSEDDVAQLAPYLEADLFFFGHTHVQGGFLCHRNGILRVSGPVQSRVEIALERDQRYLFNPGSVGQPRDGDPRAAFATYDGDERLVTLGRVSYDVSGAQKKILSAGLPDILALRLQTGS
jgi:diadenosine tetraphosphatase ApaH/serine/threonine PP2A family protein phosphatase